METVTEEGDVASEVNGRRESEEDETEDEETDREERGSVEEDEEDDESDGEDDETEEDTEEEQPDGEDEEDNEIEEDGDDELDEYDEVYDGNTGDEDDRVHHRRPSYLNPQSITPHGLYGQSSSGPDDWEEYSLPHVQQREPGKRRVRAPERFQCRR